MSKGPEDGYLNIYKYPGRARRPYGAGTPKQVLLGWRNW